MNIYIDFDDCLCETAKSFSNMVKRMFDIDVPDNRSQSHLQSGHTFYQGARLTPAHR